MIDCKQTGERPGFNHVYGGVSIAIPIGVKLKSMLSGQKGKFCISANMSDKRCIVKDLLILSVPWHYQDDYVKHVLNALFSDN